MADADDCAARGRQDETVPDRLPAGQGLTGNREPLE
jgi:hypothetical protein